MANRTTAWSGTADSWAATPEQGTELSNSPSILPTRRHALSTSAITGHVFPHSLMIHDHEIEINLSNGLFDEKEIKKITFYLHSDRLTTLSMQSTLCIVILRNSLSFVFLSVF